MISVANGRSDRATRSRATPHRIVLEGQLPGAARFHPPAGGQTDEDALWPHLLEAVPHVALAAGAAAARASTSAAYEARARRGTGRRHARPRPCAVRALRTSATRVSQPTLLGRGNPERFPRDSRSQDKGGDRSHASHADSVEHGEQKGRSNHLNRRIEKGGASVKAFRHELCFSAARTFDAVFAEFPSSTAHLA
jgi:hypothetical protein